MAPLSEAQKATDQTLLAFGTSLAVQWLRLRASNAGVRVQSLLGELRSHMLRGMAKKNKKTNTLLTFAGDFPG